MSSKLLLCVFLDNVYCSFRKTVGFTVMNRCYRCSHYLRFMREMEEEDDKIMDEIDRERLEREKLD